MVGKIPDKGHIVGVNVEFRIIQTRLIADEQGKLIYFIKKMIPQIFLHTRNP